MQLNLGRQLDYPTSHLFTVSMPSFIARWPVWYLLLVLYCAYLAFGAFRFFRRSQPGLKSASAAATTPHERGQIAGYRTRLVIPIGGWILATGGLLTGALWIRWVVAGAFLISAPTVFHDYAIGFAEGRKAAELAAALDYVRGRVRPTRAVYVAATVYAGLTRVVPAVITLYAIWAT